MKTKLTYFLLPALMLSISLRSEAAKTVKDQASDFHAQFDVAFLLGAQVYNDNFLYNPGMVFLGSYGKQLNKKAFIGMGSGVMLMEDIAFTPVFIDFTGNRGGRNPGSLINLQLGYAPGFDRFQSMFANSHISGGMFLGTGVGQQFTLGDHFSFALILAYRHQFARIEYRVAEAYLYSEKMNFDMLSLGIKIIL